MQLTVSQREPFEKFAQDAGTHVMKTAFTVPNKGNVDVCIENTAPRHTVAGVSILTGALAKDFSQIAKKEHLDPVVAELRTVEEFIKEYRSRQIYLVGNEASSRGLVESTHTRVAILTAVNILVLVICSLTSLAFLRSFFRAKKII